jgi:hypothetical protein
MKIEFERFIFMTSRKVFEAIRLSALAIWISNDTVPFYLNLT